MATPAKWRLTFLFILSSVILLSRAELEDDEEKQIPNELADNYEGQCPTPTYCRRKKIQVCKTTDIDCSEMEAGPYVPNFVYWAIEPRQWTLNMSHNTITTLDSTSFFTSNLMAINLTSLDMSDNYISSIVEGTFRDGVGEKLSFIDFSTNHLESIKMEVFDGLPTLKTLKLANNRLLSVNSFCHANMPVLNSLTLQHNRISWMADKCFNNAGRELKVNLEHNIISALGTCESDNKWSVYSATMSTNPIVCGCNQCNNCAAKCWDIKIETESSESDLQDCTATCYGLTVDVSYMPESPQEYTLDVKIDTENYQDEYTVTLIEFINYGNETAMSMAGVSQQEITASSGNSVTEDGSTKYTFPEPLNYDTEYTVCVKTGQQSKCQKLRPYRYRSESARIAASSMLLVILSTIALL